MITRGQLINDRYEIIRSIGEGGMANVYLAQDTILDRQVAVKILRGDLAEDEKFVRRFQREAISASSLNDPNIVEVYDVGEDDGKYFIVMEYVQGPTLKQLIKKRGSLTLPEAQDIMLQLTSAVAHAHESYIIHRDIKPQNVVILEDGRVKIMDFGIAVALNAGELTQTNSVMGTVYYIPPEQANGGAATVKSDIYSLGILMYELVTGHVPFKGDSPVEVAIKHMNEPLPSICEYDPEMPQSIENIILRASAKNPKNRYDTAQEMHEDLETALNKERFNEPKVVYKYPEKDFDDSEPKKSRASRNAENEEKKKEKRINKALIIVGAIIGVLLLGLLFVFVIWPKISSSSQVEIPDVQGMTVAQAEKALENEGLEVSEETVEEASDEIEEGKVIGTDPDIGEKVKKGSEVTLIISTGSDKIEIEDYTGENINDVKEELEAYGIKVITDTKDVASSEGAEENIILEQDVEPGTLLGDGDTITLTIPNIYITYPDFTDGTYTLSDVKTFCTNNGLSLDVTYSEDASKTNGTITYQNMQAGTRVSSGANLRIIVIENTETATETDTGDIE